MDKHFLHTLKARAIQLGKKGWDYLRSQPPLKLLFLGVALPLLLLTLYFTFLFVRTMSGAYGHLPEKAELALVENAEASSVISEDGQLIGKYFRENRISVPLEEISPYVTEALIATEDSRFFEHQGIDLRALLRVAIKTKLLGDTKSGGGSTISQQLAKQLYPRVSGQDMLKTKFREMIIASRLEEVYNKQELLALYLNTVPFGELAFGIEVASNRFFSKSASELRAEEAAVLVGLLKSTRNYNPRNHPEASTGRRNVVLDQMVKNGVMSQEKVDSLSALPLEIKYRRENNKVGSAAHFRRMLRREVEHALAGKTHPDRRPYDIDRDGLRIHVSINSILQRLAEEAVLETMPNIQAALARDWSGGRKAPWEAAFLKTVEKSPRYQAYADAGKSREQIMELMKQPRQMTIYDWKTAGPVDTLMRPIDSLRHYFTLLNAGLLATDPRNGTVRAWVGGVDYRFVQYDHVTARRQVGSTIKPVIYATALQEGMRPCEYTPAQQFTIEDFKDYNPRNPNGDYEGAYSMRGGLAKSINTVAVNLAVRSGLQRVVNEIHEMGITGKVEAIPSVALGTVEATLPEMNLVYSGFANRGRRPLGIHFLDKIETADGELIVSFARPKETKTVMSDTTAAIATYLMSGVVNSGTGARLRSTYGISGPLAGKTGTTQDQSDGWFVGYTPKLVVSTWVGAEYPAVHFRTLSRGSATKTALPVWGTFMRKVQRTGGINYYKGGGFPALDEMTTALLECPDYLDELPIYRDPEEFMPVDDIATRLQRFPAQDIEQMMARKRRRHNESPAQYAERIARQLEREARKDERREERKAFWAKTLFGKKDGGE
ncbi:transglycosylase domain-containing protein [Neolewinella agarilytica]|uniref:transglycosylase domain-containing protein n=1 Tax=Neolewinella agarilytica TaxID=478744 RepID=UPI0023577028|nr:transglycosylase domain-containing protein [Neolewinella agarilytica]